MSKSNKYLRRLAEPLYLPLDADRAPEGFEFESASHPHLKLRPLTYGEMMSLSGIDPAALPAEVAALVVGRGGDWSLCAYPEPGESVEHWMRAVIPGRDLNEMVQEIVKANTLSADAGNG